MYMVNNDGLKFNDNKNTIILTPLNNNKCQYDLYTGDKLFYSRIDKNPLSLGGMKSELIKHIKELALLDTDDKTKVYIDARFNDNLNKLKTDLEDYYQALISQKETDELKKQYQEKMMEEQMIKESLIFYEEHTNFIIYLVSLFDWVSAGERNNIIIVFLSFCSQIILNEPISVIGLGDGSSGKTFIIQTALKTLPNEYVVNEKKGTLASMFRRSQDDPNYYDGKIVNLGDLGDVKDKDEQADVLNILKELQTEGHLERPIVTGAGANMETVNLILDGKPCLTYTTVPNKDFDSQELSRANVFRPRTDNKKSFDLMKKCLEWIGGTSHTTYLDCEKILHNQVPYVIKHLKKRFKDVDIINPYMNILQEFIGSSEFYKRDIDKYNNIIKVISVFNHQNNKIFFNHDTEREFMFVKKDDVQLFISMMSIYHSSIQYNISQQATEIYEDLLENFDDYVFESQKGLSDDQLEQIEDAITVEDFKTYSKIEGSKRYFWNYFKELRDEGLIRSVDKKGKSNMYALTDYEHISCKNMDISLSHDDLDLISYEYGSEVFSVIDSDIMDNDLSIFNQDMSIKKPLWG